MKKLIKKLLRFLYKDELSKLQSIIKDKDKQLIKVTSDVKSTMWLVDSSKLEGIELMTYNELKKYIEGNSWSGYTFKNYLFQENKTWSGITEKNHLQNTFKNNQDEKTNS